MMDLLIASPIYWLGLRAVLAGTKLTALQYNKLVFQVTESLSEESELTQREIQFTLLPSPLEVQPGNLYSSLRELTQLIRSNGKLTSMQRTLATMALQKMEEAD